MVDRNEVLFWSIFRNVYIRSEISYQVKLFKENNRVIVKSLIDLINHQYMEYISVLYYNTNDPLLPLGILPGSLRLLSFGDDFNNRIVVGDIPFGIQKLWFLNYNYPLSEGLFPESIIELKLNGFNTVLKRNQIPSNVIYLDLSSYDQPLDAGVIPNKVQHLILTSYSNKTLDFIPPSVTSLVLSKLLLNNNIIPPTIQKLKLYYNTQLKVGDLGSTISELHLVDYNTPLSFGIIPSSVKILNLGSKFNQILKNGDLPNELVELDLGVQFNQTLSPNTFPLSLQSITFGYGFHQTISDGVFLPSIKLIRFRNRRMKPLINVNSIPVNTKLEFGSLS